MPGSRRGAGLCPCVSAPPDEVRTLDYRHCSLDFLPPEVFVYERTLEELHLDANQIKDLPRELFCCHSLHTLTVSDNEIISVPPAVASLLNLHHLDISKNGVVDLPDNIKQCKNLRVIEASVNPLGKLPEGFTQLPMLTELYLNDTFLDYLPGSFGRLTRLKILELRENHLKTLPKSIARLTLLERLDIGHNEFTEIPDVIGFLTSLLELWCDQNQLKTVPPEVGQLKQLMFLDASKNRLVSLPAELAGCVALADLHVSSNLLPGLPDSLGRLSALTTLKVDDNRLLSLPSTLGGMVSLSELNVGANDLEFLPPSIGRLRHLRTLYADENFLCELPPELGSCTGLTVLSLRSNNLTSVPDELGRIPRLRVLNLSDNKLTSLPFSMTRLKELQALWLAENQTKPLVRLQSEIDPDTGQRSLTCYLLPQQPHDDREELYSDADSFHPSMWEEERRRRQRIGFDFGADSAAQEEAAAALKRTPTPYPKEMKNRVQHMRNLALKQLSGANGNATGANGDSGKQQQSPAVPPPPPSGHHPDHPTPGHAAADAYTLYHADKEKLAKDKVRLKKSTESVDSLGRSAKSTKSPGRDEDDGGFLTPGSNRRTDHSTTTSSRGVTTTVPRSQTLPPDALYGSVHALGSPPGYTPGARLPPPPGHSMPSLHQQHPSYQDFLMGLQQQQRREGHRYVQPNRTSAPPSFHPAPPAAAAAHHRARPAVQGRRSTGGAGYDSDTGYRSDTAALYHHHRAHDNRSDGYVSDAGYRSDVVAYGNSHRKSSSSRQHASGGWDSNLVKLRSRGGGEQGSGYASDTGVVGFYHGHPGYRPLSTSGSNMDQRTRSGSNGSTRTQDSSSQQGSVIASNRGSAGYGSGNYGYSPSSSAIRSDELYEAATNNNNHKPGKSRRDSAGHRGVTEVIREETAQQQQVAGDDTEQYREQLHKAAARMSRESPGTADRQVSSPSVHAANQASPPPYSTATAAAYSTPSTPSTPRPGSLPLSQPQTPLSINTGAVSPVKQPLSSGAPASTSQYDADVAVYKQVEPTSQVSSSTDSGYGHLYERTAQPGVSPNSVSSPPQSQPDTPPHRAPAAGAYTPGGTVLSPPRPQQQQTQNSTTQQQPQQLAVTIHKNPGLGFSIAGGLGSPGNPFRPHDNGIFITKVAPEGAAAGVLLPGDKIIAVNDVSFLQLQHAAAVDVLRKSGAEVNMTIHRY